MATPTPYDTGERAQPFPWVSSTDVARDRLRDSYDTDRYGRVDFDNDEGCTLATVYVERGLNGVQHLVVDPQGAEDLRVIVRRD